MSPQHHVALRCRSDDDTSTRSCQAEQAALQLVLYSWSSAVCTAIGMHEPVRPLRLVRDGATALVRAKIDIGLGRGLARVTGTLRVAAACAGKRGGERADAGRHGAGASHWGGPRVPSALLAQEVVHEEEGGDLCGVGGEAGGS